MFLDEPSEQSSSPLSFFVLLSVNNILLVCSWTSQASKARVLCLFLFFCLLLQIYAVGAGADVDRIFALHGRI